MSTQACVQDSVEDEVGAGTVAIIKLHNPNTFRHYPELLGDVYYVERDEFE